jgi:hypothetical protein
LKLNLIFFKKLLVCKTHSNHLINIINPNNIAFKIKKKYQCLFNFSRCFVFIKKSGLVKKSTFLSAKLYLSNIFLSKMFKKIKFFLFFNKFLINFLEIFFKKNILLNIKKGSNKLVIRQISLRKFTTRYFKRYLRIGKHILGIMYYTFLLKDSTIFVNYIKIILERVNLKSHKKIFLGLKKLIKDIFKPIFNFLGLLGLFFNVKGKIGVSGNAKKRRYFFYYGKHSLVTKTLKTDYKFTSIWTSTGSLGFSFFLFF